MTSLITPALPSGTAPVVRYPNTAAVGYAGDETSFLVDLLSDPTIAWYEPLAIPLDQTGAIELLQAFVDKQVVVHAGRWDGERPAPNRGWVLVEADRRVGACQLRPEGHGYLVGVSLLADVRNRGLGTAVFSALALYATRHLGGHYVAGEVEEDNHPSIRAMEKAGYQWVDRYQSTLNNGRLVTVRRYGA